MSELDRRLADLGDHLDVPAGDGLAAAVTARIGEPRPHRARRWLVAAAVVVAGGAAVTPAVADWLGTDEVAIEQGPPTSMRTSTTAPDAPPELGRRVTLEEAEAVAGFRPIMPSVLGEPDEVWVDERTTTPLVWLRWDDDVLMTQVVGHLTDAPVLRKYGTGFTVESTRVGRRPAYWIEGVHVVAIEDHDGRALELPLHTADSTLLIEMATFTIRLETPNGRDEAMRIARSLPGT